MPRKASAEWMAEHKAHLGPQQGIQLVYPPVGPVSVFCPGCGEVTDISNTYADPKNGERVALRLQGKERKG